jgi:hypothetical protein
MVADDIEKVIQPQVSCRKFRLFPTEHEMNFHTARYAIGCGHAAEIRLVGANSDYGITILAERIGKQEIQFPCLIASESKPG